MEGNDAMADCTPYHRAGTGTPVVLLHGMTMSWRAWRPVLPFLVGRHDVFVPTMAGHRGGPPLRPDAQPGVAAMVDVLCDQLDEAGIETAHLVGNSLGGWVALELARRGRARSVVGISPAGTWRAKRDLLRLTWLFRVSHRAVGSPRLGWVSRHRALRNVALTRMLAHPDRIPEDEVDGLLADFEECSLISSLMAADTRLEPLADFDVALCPVKIAWAERDHVIPFRRYGVPMRDAVRGAEFTTLPGVGHVPMYDDPRLIARTVLEMTTAVDAAYEDTRARRRRRSA